MAAIARMARSYSRNTGNDTGKHDGTISRDDHRLSTP
jgi:hypothetical protein